MSSKASKTRSDCQRLAVAIATLLLAAGLAQAAGTCTTATIDEPFRLPDGLLHAGGKLTLCHEQNYSPVAALHEVRVNGMGVGLFLTRQGTSEGLFGDGARPYMMFYRDNLGELSLIGVATPYRERMQLHFLDAGNRRSSGTVIALANDPALVLARARAI